MMTDRKTVVYGGTIVNPSGYIKDGWICIKGNKIVGVHEENYTLAQEPDSFDHLVDACGGYIFPGFIDVHIHGCKGYDALDGTEESLKAISSELCRHGVTSFLVSTASDSFNALERTVIAVRILREGEPSGAEVLGLHLEGPYFSPKKCGAQDPTKLRDPSIEEVKHLQELSGGTIRLISVAPELNGALEFVKWAVSSGIRVSIGHTCATYEETIAAINAGSDHATHTFNGMEPLHHRNPGAIGAVLADPRVYTEIICDGIHMHPGAVKLIANAKGADKVVLITDSACVAGMPDGEYSSVGMKVILSEGKVRLESGCLAGSILTMDKALKNYINFTGASLSDAAKASSLNPARSIGLDRYKGSLEPGKDADLTILDSELNIMATIVGGKEAFRRNFSDCAQPKFIV